MMGLMYSWATKEYLLWEMTIGQIILYLNKGIKIQNGEKEESPGLVDKSADELRAIRDEYKRKYGDIDNA
jgi:hypothetical protein